MIKVLLLFVGIFMSGALPAGAEMKEAELERDEKGVIIQRDQRVVIPRDRKVYQVASNVVRTEELGDYIERRVTTLEDKVQALEARIEELEQEKKKS